MAITSPMTTPRGPLDEWRELTTVLRQGERDAREESERALDPLDAVAQVALDTEIERLLAKATNTGARSNGSAFAAGVSGFGWPAPSRNPGRSPGADVRILSAMTKRL